MDSPSRDEPTQVGRVRELIDSADLLRGVGDLVVACSGGGDSVALLDLLQSVAPEYGVQLSVAHLDHGQRPTASAADADFVQALALARGLNCHVGRLEPSRSRLSEAELRRQRIRFLTDTVARTGADAVALGHTLDDQAETVIFNLARGAARPGLAGMRPRRRLGGTVFVRPMLRLRRRELREYLRDTGQTWREDETNDDAGYTRNLLRQTVVKDLEGAVPGAVANIGRAAEVLQIEEEWLADIVHSEFAGVVAVTDGQGAALDVGKLSSRPRALQTRILRQAISLVRGDLRGISREHLDGVLDNVLEGDEPARDLPGIRVRKDGANLRFLPLEGRRLKHAERP